MERIAAHFVATVLTKNNVTISVVSVPTDVMTATKEVIVHKVLITLLLVTYKETGIYFEKLYKTTPNLHIFFHS